MLPKLPSCRSIGTRLIVLLLTMVIVLFGGLGILVSWQNIKSLKTSLNSKSASVVDLAARTGADYLSTFNYMALDQLVDDVCKDSDVAFAAFYGERGQVTRRPVPADLKGVETFSKELKDPVTRKVIGRLKIGYRQHSIHESLIRSITMVSAGTILAILLFSIGIALASKRLIVKPISRLCDFAGQVAKGDLTRKLTVITPDELGALASSLNSMVEDLSRLVQQVDDAEKELHSVTSSLSGASSKVTESARKQGDSASSTSAAMIEINSSFNEISNGMCMLGESASENSSTILELAASIEEVALNAESLAVSVEDVSASIIEMAYTIKQVGNGVATLKGTAISTASSLVQMDCSVNQVEQRANETAAISEEVRRDAELGKEAVDATIVGIGEIRQSWDVTSNVIEALSAKAENISAILSVIDEVAEQTNLLALNAAIIAAQAGEHGKGFSVVADEIKELAERTSSSTREIVSVIRDVQDETHRAVQAIRQAEVRIDEGERLSEKSGQALAKILASAKNATVQVEGIARTTMEQACNSKMLRSAMEEVSDMVARIATATQEQVKGSEVIMKAAERMKGISFEVSRSMREQSKAGSAMGQSTERILDMIGQIARACEEQSRGGEQVVQAAEGIRLSSGINVEATEMMGEAVARLRSQAEQLKKVLGAFTV